jgi:hypothetical protein
VTLAQWVAQTLPLSLYFLPPSFYRPGPLLASLIEDGETFLLGLFLLMRYSFLGLTCIQLYSHLPFRKFQSLPLTHSSGVNLSDHSHSTTSCICICTSMPGRWQSSTLLSQLWYLQLHGIGKALFQNTLILWRDIDSVSTWSTDLFKYSWVSWSLCP